MENFEVDEDGIYKVQRAFSINHVEMREMVVSKDALIEALHKWGLLKLAADEQEVRE